MLLCGHHGVARAQALLLDGIIATLAQRLPDGIAAAANDDDRAAAHRPGRLCDPCRHALPRTAVQNFRRFGLHPRPFACR